MKSTKQLREMVGEIMDKCDALNELCASEDREMTADESKQFDAWMAEIGNDGRDGEAKTGLQAQIDRADKFERLVNQRREPANTGLTTTNSTVQSTPAAVADHVGRLRAFKDPQAAYDCGMWFKAHFLNDAHARNHCIDNGIKLQQTIGDNTKGGYTVPKPLSAAIINVREAVGVTRQTARVGAMTANTLDWPKRVSGQTVYYPGEATAITPSEKTFDQINLVAVKRAVLTQLSNELVADSIINIMDDVAMDAGHALAYREDQEYINGDGSAGFGTVSGLVANCGAGGTVTASGTEDSTITLENLSQVMGKVQGKFWMDGMMCWIMSRPFYADVITKLMFAAGGNYPATIGGATPVLWQLLSSSFAW